MESNNTDRNQRQPSAPGRPSSEYRDGVGKQRPCLMKKRIRVSQGGPNEAISEMQEQISICSLTNIGEFQHSASDGRPMIQHL